MEQYLLTVAASLLTNAGFDVTTFNIVALAWVLVVLTGVSILVYLLPAIVAEERKHQHRSPILLLNLLLGWTFLGWVGALVWATMPVIPPKLPVAPAIERQAA